MWPQRTRQTCFNRRTVAIGLCVLPSIGLAYEDNYLLGQGIHDVTGASAEVACLYSVRLSLDRMNVDRY